MAYSTLAAIYETPAAAKAAAAELVSAGFNRDDMKLFPTDTDDADNAGTTRSSSSTTSDDRGGFFSWLFGKDQPEAEVTHYSERFEKGNSALSLRVEDARHDEAADILERHSPIDVDQQSDTQQPGTMSTTSAAGMSTAAVGSTAAPMPMASTARATDGDGSLQLVEEKLSIGKRQVQGGRVRLRTYTVETPVSETIRLRDEKISIERRASTGDVKLGTDPFKERTIELTESCEEAVVSKNVRVKEEVVVGKQSVDRDQVVSDTVRHTEVDVDRDGVTEERSVRSDLVGDRAVAGAKPAPGAAARSSPVKDPVPAK